MKAIIVQVLPLQWLLPTTSPSTSEVLINGDLKEKQLQMIEQKDVHMLM